LPRVVLRPFADAHFEAWFDVAATSHAADQVRAGNWPPDGAVEKARGQLRQLLPDGTRSAGHHLYHVLDDATAAPVGSLWVLIEPHDGRIDAFIYDIVIDQALRGRGYGEATMRAAEVEARRLGATRIGLHVFGFNTVARRLYEKLGYETTNINMEKPL
jgi:ribosomal protein S18 acetylase RimI-like enzyme